jgi:hypothetical protein
MPKFKTACFSLVLLGSFGLFAFSFAYAETKSEPKLESKPETKAVEIPSLMSATELTQKCEADLRAMEGDFLDADIKSICLSVRQLENCHSENGAPIYHLDRAGIDKKPKHILAKALIHGDETASGNIARAWMARLQKIDPRNTWRVIPVANPDGWKARTRTNSHGVDLNRNFPTQDWSETALTYWKTKMKSDPRRNPGTHAGSEIETRCLMKQFDDFKPDFIISIHTPLGVLDLDGPKIKNPPPFKPLPWTSLGNFPGSLGRFMWRDRKVPVLTIELKGNEGLKRLEDFDRLQDISGTIAIQAAQVGPNTSKVSTKE